ncbi:MULTISPECIES: ABC transporter substrate-binding protein [unclassified Paenibacillus]|uniref:ABC transporter substrate-binding protein n=3 Tax=Paenibacillus TaxID=44249 RepID=UPI00040C9A6D|nr:MULTISPECIES: ABC transporter substrate-binding protein [unclassified Paenibacillus]CDN45965.1 hypothetical protein BN871_JT_00100 [Paenibacillus sp. P22]
MARTKRFLAVPSLIAALIGSSVIAGCSSTAGLSTSQSIKIVADSKSQFDTMYRDYIEAAYPGLSIELVEMNPDYTRSVTPEMYEQVVKEQKPDLLLIWDHFYSQLGDKQLLEDLAPYMKASGLRKEDLYDGMPEMLSAKGGGKLLGLSPDVTFSVLRYNKELFAKAGVESPRDGMSIEEVYELAGRFNGMKSGGKTVSGLHMGIFNTPSSLVGSYLQSEGMSDISADGTRLLWNAPELALVLDKIVQLYRSGSFALEEDRSKVVNGVKVYDKEAVEAGEHFAKGLAAMTFENYGGQKYGFETGEVTPPVLSRDRSRSTFISTGQIMSIPRTSDHKKAAWAIIRLMLSEHIAKAKIKLGYPPVPISSYPGLKGDSMLDKLFELKPYIYPQAASLPKGWDSTSMLDFDDAYAELKNKEITAAVQGSQTASQAAANIQKRGQELLDNALAKVEN